ncbi:LysR family transcriptional regulator [soil metagenome]
MNIHDIEAFVAVADTGSVNRAALRLNLTQPATTRRIQNFELAMGEATLFDRSVKPALLTALGVHVLEQSRRVLAAVAELEACGASAGDPAGILKVGVAHGLGEMVLTSPLDALRQTFARIRLQVSSNWSARLTDEVRAGALDCAIGLLTEVHSVPPSLTRIPLGSERVVIVSAAKASTKRDGTPWRLRDLAATGWYLNPPGCGCRTALIKAFERCQLSVDIAAEVFGEELQLSLLAKSGGLGLVPQRQFEHSPHRRDLRILDVMDFSLPATITLIRSAVPGRLDPAIDLLVAEMKTKLDLPSFLA